MTHITTKDLTLHAFSSDELDLIYRALIVAEAHSNAAAEYMRGDIRREHQALSSQFTILRRKIQAAE